MLGPVTDIAPTITTPKKSYEEFLKQYQDRHAEWVNGEVIEFMSASVKHQQIVIWLATILNLFVQRHALGEILTAPYNMYMEQIQRGREPDIMFIHQDRLNIMQPTYLDGPADMVVEVISPESVGRDRGHKFVEYEAAGVTEYWLIDPARQMAEFYRLAADGRYRVVNLTVDGKFESTILPGFWLSVTDLWQTPLPNLFDMMTQLGLLK